MEGDSQNWAKHFRIESEVDLDFVIGQNGVFPVGMRGSSPPEFKRRILAAMVSYDLHLTSIDYTLKRYVDPDQYEEADNSLGGVVSNYLRGVSHILMNELRELQTKGNLSFGVLGAELTLFKLPHALDTARMLSNRGLLLEVLPLLRTCLEMIAWAHSAFHITDEELVVELKAQNCISSLKKIYGTAGKLYGRGDT